jgi:hypothetical protein
LLVHLHGITLPLSSQIKHLLLLLLLLLLLFVCRAS